MAFKKAEKTKHGGKFLVYGKPSCGKSYFGLTFPKIAALDSETGLSDYINKDIEIGDKKYNNVVFVDPTSNLEDLEENLDTLLDGDYDKDVSTFVVDSESKIYSAIQLSCLSVAEKQARKKGQDIEDVAITMRGWGRIKNLNMKYQQAKIALSSKGMHIVSVAQGIDITNDDGKAIGVKPDMAKNIQFDYDVIIYFFTKEEKVGDDKVIKYYGEIKKDRTNVTKIGQIIENITYDIWKDYYESDMESMKTENAYRNDLASSEKYVSSSADKSEALATEWKDLMKQLKEDKNMDAISKINTLIKDKKIDIKKIDMQSVEDLTELLDFTKLQL